MYKIIFRNLFVVIVLTLLGTEVRADFWTGSFPNGTETRQTARGDRFWNESDFIEETLLNTSVASVTTLDLDLVHDVNSLMGDTQDMDVILNGVTIGSLMIQPGDSVTSIRLSGFDVAATGGDGYVLRLETTRTVIAGRGSAGIGIGSSNLTIGNPIPEPGSVFFLAGLAAMLAKRKREGAGNARCS
ncbi:MAG: hypothetical protein AAF333_14870 [Planctomycetota bacterium]